MSSKKGSGSGKKKKIVASAMAVALAAALMIGGTFSYLKSKSDLVTNSFTPNTDYVELTEDDNDYQIIPGTSQKKNPTVTYASTVDTYVFVEVTDATDGLVEWEIADGWTLLSSSTDDDGVTTYIYYQKVEATGYDTDGTLKTETLSVLKDNTVSYSAALDNDDMLESSTDEDGNTTYTLKSGITLSFQAYTIQADPFYSNAYDSDTETYDETTAAENAWLALYYGIESDVTGDIVEVSTYDELVAALEDEDVGYIVLTDIINLSDTLTVDSEVTIDLAGYSLTNSSGTAIKVTEDGDLTITDSSSEGSGTISGSVNSESAQYIGGAITVSGGNLVVEAGTITGTISGTTSSASYTAGAVYVGAGGSFEFTGGTISNSSSTSYQSAGAVYVTGNSTFTMSEDATISSCSSTGSQYCAGAVVLAYGSSFEMTGGTITGCSATSANYNTGGVAVLGESTFTMSDGTITSCTGYRGGAVLLADASAFTLSGGSITNNTANYSGGAIYIYDDGTSMTMTGGSITSNTCSSGKGGGIRACSNTYLTITGGTISGNTGGTGNNAYIDSSSTLLAGSDILTDYYIGGTTY